MCSSDLVAIGSCAGDDAGADGAAAAGPVIDHHLLTKLLADPWRDKTGQRIRAAAGHVGHYQAYRAHDARLRLNTECRQSQQGRKKHNFHDPEHAQCKAHMLLVHSRGVDMQPYNRTFATRLNAA